MAKEPPEHKYIKQIYNWFFKIEENNKEVDYNTNSHMEVSEKIQSLFGTMASSSKTNDVVAVYTINDLKDIGL